MTEERKNFWQDDTPQFKITIMRDGVPVNISLSEWYKLNANPDNSP